MVKPVSNDESSFDSRLRIEETDLKQGLTTLNSFKSPSQLVTFSTSSVSAKSACKGTKFKGQAGTMWMKLRAGK